MDKLQKWIEGLTELIQWLSLVVPKLSGAVAIGVGVAMFSVNPGSYSYLLLIVIGVLILNTYNFKRGNTDA